MQCHPHPTRQRERPTVNHLLSAWINARNNKNQQARGSNHHRRPLLNHEHREYCCQMKPSSRLLPRKLQGMHAKKEVRNLHQNGSSHAGICLRCLGSPLKKKKKKDVEQLEKVQRQAAVGTCLTTTMTDRQAASQLCWRNWSGQAWMIAESTVVSGCTTELMITS